MPASTNQNYPFFSLYVALFMQRGIIADEQHASDHVDISRVAGLIVDNSFEVTPPQVLGQEGVHELRDFISIQMRIGGQGGGRVIKPGNIFLNISKLLQTAATAGITAIAGVTIPNRPELLVLIAVLGTVPVVGDIRSGMKREVCEKTASILWALHNEKKEDGLIDKGMVPEVVNGERSRNGLEPLSDEDIWETVVNLVHRNLLKDIDTDHFSVVGRIKIERYR